MLTRRSQAILILICTLCLLTPLPFSPGVSAQTSSKRLSRTIPLRLERQLTERLRLFTRYQQNGEWENLAPLLTDSIGEMKLTPEQIQTMLTTIKKRPVIAFVAESVVQSTANFSRPLRQREWQIQGCGEYRDVDRLVRFRAMVFTHIRKGQWVFGPIVRSFYSPDLVMLSCRDEIPKQ